MIKYIRWNQTGKLIADPTLDFFHKRLNVQFLNKKFKKNRNLVAFLKVKLFVENLQCEGKKQYSSKTNGFII